MKRWFCAALLAATTLASGPVFAAPGDSELLIQMSDKINALAKSSMGTCGYYDRAHVHDVGTMAEKAYASLIASIGKPNPRDDMRSAFYWTYRLTRQGLECFPNSDPNKASSLERLDQMWAEQKMKLR
jgi:hypothetical protein